MRRSPSVIDFTKDRAALGRVVERRRVQIDNDEARKSMIRTANRVIEELPNMNGTAKYQAEDLLLTAETLLGVTFPDTDPKLTTIFGYEIPPESKLGSYFTLKPGERKRGPVAYKRRKS